MRKILYLFVSACILSAGLGYGCSNSSDSEPLTEPEVEPETGENSETGGGIEFTDAAVELYAYSNEIVPSVYYGVEVNGESAFVIPTIEHDVCTFGCDGAVTVRVKSRSEVITSAAVLPKSKNYEYVIHNGDLYLTLSPGDKVAVEINGSSDSDLFIFVNPIETDKPDESDPNVLFYRAGTVTEVSVLSVTSGQTVYIEGGAVVKGVLSAKSASDITVKGCGIIDARDHSQRGIQFQAIENLVIEDVTMINNINWSTFISESDNVTFDNYKVVAVYNPENSTGCENDALDILGCRDVKVTGCFCYAHDDVFCIKSHKWSYKGEVDNVVFEDCIAWNHLSGNALVIGAETNENVSNVTYRNCYVIHSAGRTSTLYRGGVSVHNCAGGLVSDILFENIYLEDCLEYGVYFDIRQTNYDIGTGVEWTPGTIDGITLKNIEILKTPPYGNMMAGYDGDEHKIYGVVLNNVRQEGTLITADNISDYFTVRNTEYSFE